MTATLQNFEIIKSNTKVLRIPVTENGWPRPLTGLTAEWDMSTAAGEASVLSKTTISGITIPASEADTAVAGDTYSITLASGASAEDGFYQGRHVRLTGGTGQGQWRLIVSYNGDTKEAIVDRGWKTVPNATTTYLIVDSSLDITIDDSDTAAMTVGSYYHRARITDGASEPSTVTTGTADIID